MCLVQAKAVSIKGHPTDLSYNGLYTHDSTHEGWPVLKNAKGKYCYRHTPKDKWFLRAEFTPDSGTANASILAKEGPLPVGAHTWQVWFDGKRVGCTLTASLLIGPAVAAAEAQFAAEATATNAAQLAADKPPPPPASEKRAADDDAAPPAKRARV